VMGNRQKFDEIISPEDVAMYQGLCALASLDRRSLKKTILDDVEVKKFLELAPDVYKLIKGFYESEYSNVMRELNDIKKYLIVDIYLCSNVENLLTAIRGKALVQYFSPYSAMDIRKMAKAFGVSLEVMENELSRCIGDNHIAAKIDSHNKVVYASTSNRRTKLFASVLDAGEDFSRDMKCVLMRMSCQKEGVQVVQPREYMMDIDDDDDEMGGKGLMNFARRGLGLGAPQKRNKNKKKGM